VPQRRASSALTSLAVACVGAIAACQPIVQSAAAGSEPAPLAQLWFKPEPNRDLFCGVGGCKLAPDPNMIFSVVTEKTRGYSYGFTVRDSELHEWSAKSLPEAKTEVVASRVFWGVGYHQPPIFYLNEWRLDDDEKFPNPQAGARFRQKSPDLYGLDAGGTWSYYRNNPFLGTPQLNGMIVLHIMLGSSDLKDEQNAIYHLAEPFEGATRWYVARDLGQSFGSAQILNAPRGDIEAFEKTGFIKGVKNGKVQFEWGGRHLRLAENITPADVRWICRQLNALTDAQWHDAFRAGGFTQSLADRFIRHMKTKIAAGLRLEG